MHKLMVIFAVLFLSLNVFSQEEPLIKAGEAKSRKSNIAFPEFNPATLGTHASAKTTINKLKQAAESALKLSNYFDIMNPSAFLENTSKVSAKPESYEVGGFKFETWKTIGTEFLIRGTYEINGSEIVLDVFLYQVDLKNLKLGKKYRTPVSNAEQLGYTLANDILQAVTGRGGPFNTRILATVANNSGNKEVVTMNWDGSGLNVITSDRNVNTSPNWSPDNKKIIYSHYTKRQGSAQQNVTMFIHNLETKKRSILSNRNGTNTAGSFSPDGKFVYLTISKNGQPDIYKINLDGDQVAQLTKGPAGAMNVEAAVSPDGSKIAFSSDRGGKPMIYVMDSDGSNVKRLTIHGNYNSTPAWSPDGKKIAFTGEDGNFTDIFIMNADGSDLQRVTEARKSNGRRASNEDPSFSPDGRFVVFVSNRHGNKQIYISTIDGANEQRVTNDTQNYFKPKWSKSFE